MSDTVDLPVRLAAPDLRRIPLYRFDVLVIGSGVAGSSAALAAADAGAEVALVAKGSLTESNTVWAQGGVAAVFSPEDSIAAHVADTLSVGCDLCELETVEIVVRDGPRAVTSLLERGAKFDRDASGAIELSREGGHSHPRVLHAGGDSTGREIQATMVASVNAHPKIACFPETFVADLLREEGGAAAGALAYSKSGNAVGFAAPHVVLATGGAGQLYRETTNPVIATGDGVALALRFGAAVRDLEFFQFHPTCLYIAGAARVLISEIVRGAGGVLRDRNGERFMQAFHPAAELAPRDVVSRAVAQRMLETQDTNVYLDLSHVQGDPHQLFPGISATCRYFGIDIAKDPLPVRPGLHYMIGGIESDVNGATSIEGLWAVGECASSGLHGANRMGSNSLLEGLVVGARVGERAAGAVTSGVGRSAPEPAPAQRPSSGNGLRVNLPDVLYSLKSLMWRQMGVVRSAEKLHDALPKLDLWTRAVEELAPSEPRTFELLNMLTIAHLSVRGALAREESRGVHFREDFPDTIENWRMHTRLVPRFDEREGFDRIVALDVERSPLRTPAAAT